MASVDISLLIPRNPLPGDVSLVIGADGVLALVNDDVVVIPDQTPAVYGETITINNVEVL